MAPFKSRVKASRRMSPTSELLPEPETPVTQTKSPSGNAASIALRLLCVAPLIVKNRPSGTLRSARNRDRLLARQVRAGQALARTGQVVDRPLGDDLASLDAGPWPEVNKMVGRAHRVFIVLDDDHRVAQLGEPAQGRQQSIVVTRVQADRRLVENIEDAHQPRADLAGQADSLRFAARERRRGPIEGQVMQADVDQECEPRANFLEQFFGDRPRDGIERESTSIARARSRQAGSPSPGLQLGAGLPTPPSASASKNRATWPMGIAPSSTKVLPPTVTARARGLSLAPAHSGQVMLRMYGSSWLRTGPPEAPRYLARSSLATPTHFSACDQTLLRFFQRWTMIRSPVP